MKQLGIWLDSKVAHIISLGPEENEAVKVIFSKVEDYRIHGGSGTRLKGGPQNVVQDSRYLERQNHQFREYFADIAPYLEDADEIVIFGPAETGQKLHNALSESYKQILPKIKALKKTDSMTKNQMRAWVRDYFSDSLSHLDT